MGPVPSWKSQAHSSPSAALKLNTPEIERPSSQGTRHPRAMLRTLRAGEGIPKNSQHPGSGRFPGLLRSTRANLSMMGTAEVLGRDAVPAGSNHARPISTTGETRIHPIFAPFPLGCNNSSQYRKRAGRDLGIGHPLPSPRAFLGCLGAPGVPPPASCKAQTTCTRPAANRGQVTGHLQQRRSKEGRGQALNQHSSPEDPFPS